jgi:hypothetical protein
MLSILQPASEHRPSSVDATELIGELMRLAKEVNTRHRKGQAVATMSTLVAFKPLVTALLAAVQHELAPTEAAAECEGAPQGAAGYL